MANKRGRKPGLTPKQERFCREYVVDLNGKAAALRAGYTEKDAGREACILLKKPHVREIVEKLKTKQYARLEIKADNVLLELSRIGFVDPGGLFDLKGELLPIDQLPEEIRRAVSSFEFDDLGNLTKIRFWPKVQALETLGKHFKLWIDRLEISGRVDVATALKKARERRAAAKKAMEGTTP